jgi:hypothetical protein
MRLKESVCRSASLILALSALAFGPLSASAADELSRIMEPPAPTTASNQAWGRIEWFDWREYDGKATRSKDNGPRLTVGASRAYNQDDITFTPRVTAMAGYTHYEGSLGQSFASVDTYSKTFGFGVGADVGVIYRIQGGAQVEPFLGLAWDWWRRDIASWGGPRETWDSICARGGARGSVDLRSGQSKFRGYGELGIKMPLSTQNSVKYAGYGKVALKPRGEFSPFAEAGLVLDRWRVGASYDAWRFGNSDEVALPDGILASQRKTRAGIYSINAGYAF